MFGLIDAPTDVARLFEFVLAPVVMLTVCATLLNSMWGRYNSVSSQLLQITNEQQELYEAQATNEGNKRERLVSIAQELPDFQQRSRLVLAATRGVTITILIMIGVMFTLAFTPFIPTDWDLRIAVYLFLIGLGILFRSVWFTQREIHLAQYGFEETVKRAQSLAKRPSYPKKRSLSATK